jgi:spore maturation protein A
MLAGIVIMIFTAPNLIISTMISASEKSVSLCINLLAIYAVWLGLLKILENTGFNKKLAKWLSPIISFLFGKGIDEYTKSQIAINISSNILGLGNAATPSAIKAMQGLDNKTGKINNSMTMLMVINCLSFQLLPTTVMGLMVASHSENASRVILPTICTSIVTGVIIITILKLIFKARKKKNDK